MKEFNVIENKAGKTKEFVKAKHCFLRRPTTPPLNSQWLGGEALHVYIVPLPHWSAQKSSGYVTDMSVSQQTDGRSDM